MQNTPSDAFIGICRRYVSSYFQSRPPLPLCVPPLCRRYSARKHIRGSVISCVLFGYYDCAIRTVPVAQSIWGSSVTESPNVLFRHETILKTLYPVCFRQLTVPGHTIGEIRCRKSAQASIKLTVRRLFFFPLMPFSVKQPMSDKQ